MSELTGTVLLPLIGAFLHPFLGMLIQRSTREGASLPVIVGVSNLISVLIFAFYLEPTGSWKLTGLDWLAVASGVFFFLGQWFSIQSVKNGDLAVHSSALGVKLLLVAALAAMVGLENSRPYLIPAAVLACVSVFLVAGASLAGWREHKNTVGLTLVACLFFGVNDFILGWQAKEIGAARWLVILMSTAGLMSLVLLGSRFRQVAVLAVSGNARWFVLAAGFSLGVQALLVSIAFSEFQQPTLSNVAYSTRGVMAVLVLWALGRGKTGSLFVRQIAGAILMVVSLILALQR